MTWTTNPALIADNNGINLLKTILIIEDERVIADILSTVLQDEGYEVHIAANGKEGLATLKTVHPDLVLCDLMMPIADGKVVGHAMTSNPSLSSIPLIFMSAGGYPPSDPGIRYSDFLRKPFDLNQLIDLVERWVA